LSLYGTTISVSPEILNTNTRVRTTTYYGNLLPPSSTLMMETQVSMKRQYSYTIIYGVTFQETAA